MTPKIVNKLVEQFATRFANIACDSYRRRRYLVNCPSTGATETIDVYVKEGIDFALAIPFGNAGSTTQ